MEVDSNMLGKTDRSNGRDALSANDESGAMVPFMEISCDKSITSPSVYKHAVIEETPIKRTCTGLKEEWDICGTDTTVSMASITVKCEMPDNPASIMSVIEKSKTPDSPPLMDSQMPEPSQKVPSTVALPTSSLGLQLPSEYALPKASPLHHYMHNQVVVNK
jgi:hypothetical protein